jgi:hypothetical protein
MQVDGFIKDKRISQQITEDNSVVSSYLKKAQKIETNKKRREENMQLILENRRKSANERMKRQSEGFIKQKFQNTKALEEYAKQLQTKDEKIKKNIEVTQFIDTLSRNRLLRARSYGKK